MWFNPCPPSPLAPAVSLESRCWADVQECELGGKPYFTQCRAEATSELGLCESCAAKKREAA